jgi:hypothetical protein
VATADHGDNGPFRSIVFRLGTVTSGRVPPVRLEPSSTAAWTIDAMKIEALSAPARAIPGSVMSIGTDDEHFGGVWRALFPQASLGR